LTDAELLHGARSGDAEAWRTLYQRYLPTVWRYAYARVTDVHAAEDVTSEAMLALLRNIGQLDIDKPNIAGWLRSAVEFKSIDYFRQQVRNRDRLTQIANHALGMREEPGPGASLETGETRDHVLCVLDKLTDRQREVLEYKYLDALSVRDIAARLSESEKTVESLLYRARREFRRLFELPTSPGGNVSPRQIGIDAESTT
jgi:RNA polymerase sigma-70 factor (ECF subfamily)